MQTLTRFEPKVKTKERLDLEKEIQDLNIQIQNLEAIRNDYRMLQTGEYDRNELYWEIQGLIKERNQLLAQI